MIQAISRLRLSTSTAIVRASQSALLTKASVISAIKEFNGVLPGIPRLSFELLCFFYTNFYHCS